MEHFQVFSHGDSSQQTSTPKFDRTATQKHHQLFNANESAILDVDASEQELHFIRKDKKPENARSSCKRQLFSSHNAPKMPQTSGVPITNKKLKPTEAAKSSGTACPPDDEIQVIEPLPKASTDGPKKNWSASQRADFFAAVREFGVDYEKIYQKMSASLLLKYGETMARTKSVEIVREFCQQIYGAVAAIVNPPDMTDRAFQTYALVNFGVWSTYFGEQGCKKLVTNGPLDEKHSFRNLFNSGKVEGKNNTEVATPNCTALRKIHLHDEIQNIPHVIAVRLRPRSGSSWANVRRSGRHPIAQVHMHRTQTINDLRDFLLQHWHIERKVDRYYSFDEHRLILCPSNGCVLHFPDLMPDFDTCFGVRPYSWSAYKGYEEKTASQRRRSHKHKFHHILNDDDARDADNDCDETDNPISSGNPKKRQVPHEIFKEFFDKGKFKLNSWNKQHLQTTFAELYLILGCDGQMRMNYEWILPDEETVQNLPVELFLKNDLSDLFYDRMRIKKPEPREPLRQIVPDAAAHSDTVPASTPLASQLDSGIARESIISASVPENAPAFLCSNTDTLSEFIVPNCTVQSSTNTPSVPSAVPSQITVQQNVPLQIYSSMPQMTFQLQNTNQGYILTPVITPVVNGGSTLQFLPNMSMGMGNFVQLNANQQPLMIQPMQTPYMQQCVIGEQYVQNMTSPVIAPAPAGTVSSSFKYQTDSKKTGRPPKLPRSSSAATSSSKLLKKPAR